MNTVSLKEKAREQQAALQPPVIDAARLLSGHREIILRHMGQDYRLRLTSNGKLILTK